MDGKTPFQLCCDLQTTIIEFIADLREHILTGKEEKGDLMMVEFFFQKLDPKEIMQHCVEKILPHKKKIEKRKNSFFIKKRNVIFRGIQQERIDHLANLINDGKITQDNQDIIWDYINTILVLSETYKKKI